MILMNQDLLLRSLPWQQDWRKALFQLKIVFTVRGISGGGPQIHCARRTGHGSQNFVEGAQNSCNPVFIEVGLRLGSRKLL